MHYGKSRPLGEADRIECRQLRNLDKRQWTYGRLAEYFGVSVWQVECVLAPPVMKRVGINRPEARHRKPDAPRIVRHSYTPSLTANFCGDPPPGRSALDQKRKAGQ